MLYPNLQTPREANIVWNKTKLLAFFFVLLMKLIKLHAKKQRLNCYEVMESRR